MNDEEKLTIEVACALPQRQRILKLSVPVGTDARTALKLSGIAEIFPEVDVDTCSLGIFGRVVDERQLLNAGDRVEIYRNLSHDPREQRRQLASQGLNMGRSDDLKG
ncbi:MAG: RnfH family protein [Gammaproteobacteria bacterium]